MAKEPIYLAFKWTVSRGRDTYGYNICTLTDPNGGKYRCNGGGYDMQGTVFAQWLTENYKDRLAALAERKRQSDDCAFYGLTVRPDSWYLDGGCGLSCMETIAKAIGLVIAGDYRRKTGLQGFIITDTVEAQPHV